MLYYYPVHQVVILLSFLIITLPMVILDILQENTNRGNIMKGLKKLNTQIFVFLFFIITTFIVSFFRIEKKNDLIYEPYRVLCGIYFFLCLFYPIIYILTLVFVKKEYIKKIMLFFLYLITFYLSYFLLYLL